MIPRLVRGLKTMYMVHNWGASNNRERDRDREGWEIYMGWGLVDMDELGSERERV